MPFAMAGYELAHHGEGRWNGVAIASRRRDRRRRHQLRRRAGARSPARRRAEADDCDPIDEARMPRPRMISAVCGGDPRRQHLRAERPRGRLAVLRGKLRLVRAPAPLARRDRRTPATPLVIGGDFNVAPTDLDVWDPRGLHRRHPRLRARARGVPARLRDWGLVDAVRPRHPERRAATPGGTTAPATSTRTSACASTTCSRSRSGRRARRRRPRSTARRARASRSRPTTRRCTSTWLAEIAPSR